MYKILPYYGFGNNQQIFFKGRVVIDNNYETYRAKTGLINQIVGFWKRFAVKPAGNIPVDVTFENITQTVTTNEYGIFEATFDPADNTSDKWLVAQAQIDLAHSRVIIANLNSINEVSGNEYGIISDIDDTILISKATQKIRLLYLTIFKKPADRKPFEGVAELYNHMVAGSRNDSTNPIFYVSSSHWNLYDLLTEFMAQHQFPRGPLLLKRVKGIRDTITSVGNHDHKKHKITEILTTYPDLKFVLIGDSGQRDAAIYAGIARQYPNRIRAILLRDVTSYLDPIVEQSKQIIPDTIPFRVFKTPDEATSIAAELGLANFSD